MNIINKDPKICYDMIKHVMKVGFISELLEKYDLELKQHILEQAIYNFDNDVVELLLQHGVNPNIKNSYGFAPIHMAMSSSEVELLQLLVKYGANIDIRIGKGWISGGDTALTRSISNNNFEVTKLLLENGANPDISNSNKEFPLTIAFNYDHQNIIELLLKYKANPNSSYFLAIAVSRDDIELAKLLIHYMADPNILDDNKSAPLHIAVEHNNEEMIKLLIKAGARINILDTNYYTPLHKAVIKGNIDIAKLLISLGGNVNLKDLYDNSPLKYAMKNEEMMKLLLENNADYSELSLDDQKICSDIKKLKI